MAKRTIRANSIINIITYFCQTIKTLFNFVNPQTNVKIPKILIKNGFQGKVYVYPLLRNRYLIGRSSKHCHIVIPNKIVSPVHCAIEKDPKRPNLFLLRDLNSQTGIYYGGKRYKSLPLRHNNIITLGHPKFKNVIQIRFDQSPPKWILLIRYGLFTAASVLFLLIIWISHQWSKYQVDPFPDGIAGSTVIYADDGETPLVPLISATHRELPNLKDFSPYLPKALVASEDSRYYWHFGVDPIGILRAISINTKADGIQQGASTITQQLARSIFPLVGRENTLGRKIREILVSLKIEAAHSKNDIMTIYLNRVYLGGNLYGFEDAAQFYFNKSAANLNLTETATLVAILPAPNAYNPVQDYATALELRNRVIERMFSLGMISYEEASRARRSRIEISPQARKLLSQTIAPYFYSYVYQEMNSLLGADLVQEGDFIVETSLRPEIQLQAEVSLQNYLDTTGKNYKFSQGAIATVENKTGEIVALVGGKNYRQSQFNRATQAQRQPGSTFKVFAYAAAISKGISPEKSYSCDSLSWQVVYFQPCAYIYGRTNMYQGLAFSENPIALRVAQDVGLSEVIQMAKNLGIKSKLSAIPGLVLGQSEVNVLEMTGAYATFANGGVWNRPHAIRVIRDRRDCEDYSDYQTCREIYRFNQGGHETRQAISPQLAETMTEMMQRVIKIGTGRDAYIGKGEAGKTGTTNRGVDIWFLGYVPEDSFTTGIWLGNDDNSPTKAEGRQAAILWSNYMKKIL